MSSHHPPRHCFARAFYFYDDGTLVAQFTEGEIYSFWQITADRWAELKAAAMSGTDFNAAWRPPTRSALEYHRLHSVPTGWTDFWLRP